MTYAPVKTDTVMALSMGAVYTYTHCNNSSLHCDFTSYHSETYKLPISKYAFQQSSGILVLKNLQKHNGCILAHREVLIIIYSFFFLFSKEQKHFFHFAIFLPFEIGVKRRQQYFTCILMRLLTSIFILNGCTCAHPTVL